MAGVDHFVPWTPDVAWSETDRVVLLHHSNMLFQFFPCPGDDTEAMRTFWELVASLARR